MSVALTTLRPVYVIGIGFHRYQPLSETPYVQLGLTAARAALADAGVPWEGVQSAYVATALLPMAAGRPMLRHLGATGIPIVHIENASASGSAAFRQACLEVATGLTDMSLALGVDKPRTQGRPERAEHQTGIASLADDAIVPFTHFALLADAYAHRNRVAVEDIALVAVKNHRNGASNPFAQRQKARTLDEILAGKPIAGSFTALQCTPVGEGSAAVIVASEAALRRYGVDPGRAIRVLASAAGSQRVYDDPARYDTLLTQETVHRALADAGVSPRQLDVVELHDAFTVEELEYLEAIGVCDEGHAMPLLKEGAFDIGGRCAVSPSGGLIAMGHPIGPTGIGQVGEIVRQLRHEAGDRQQASARYGLAHMVGLGAVCYAHVLARP
ncbi:Acetyl-CoA C-acyltransferase [Cupriavidus necator H850]|jgi:acetyl-CoA acetyltransferase|uniref:thiolase family protein n=1 Tax=Cupriavidus TaxID=106589 RepID=UPI00129D3ED4|nr:MULTISPECIES: thiolase family protein [Cupriavidus]KAI3599546.1 Acetyl-CoA C-acyltransferase [Cupriavidus necator H850]QUN30080.1 thiolase family protein [Cupriavidus sp. KK10]